MQGNTVGDVRARVSALLEGGLDRGALLRELSDLASSTGFDECADLWAPALYACDPDFFERFLLRHLSAREADVVQALLPRVEADGRDDLFRGLYGRVTRPETWNADLLALAHSTLSDEQVHESVERRRLSGYWYVLDGEPALALYRRSPALFGDFVASAVRAGPRTSADTYAPLLEEARRRGDDEFYWQVFRQVAGPSEWAQAVRQLLVDRVAPDDIVAELRRRHPVHAHDLDAGVLADLLKRYRGAVLPYIEENANWLSRKGAPQLLSAAEHLGDEALYWHVFFRVGKSPEWNKALRELAGQRLAESDWSAAVRLRTPPADASGRWSLAPETALALYRRDATLARPLIERWLEGVSPALFEAAERAGDEDLLDLLTTRLVWDLAWVVYKAYPTASEQQYRKADAGAHKQLEHWGQLITARLDRLYALSPATYVEHATRILSRLDRSTGWSFRRNLEHNPAFIYLYQQHHAAWLAAPAAVRELLETPNAIAQGIALDMLTDGGSDAADRAVENLAPLRAILLGGEGRTVKKRALLVLDRAARQSPAHAAAILPTLDEAMYFRAKHAIADRAMVSYVRARTHLSPAEETLPAAP